jgi:hypothetical protein
MQHPNKPEEAVTGEQTPIGETLAAAPNNVTQMPGALPPKNICDQMLKANEAYDNARKASDAMLENQRQGRDLMKQAQETSAILMTEHKTLSDMVCEWKGTSPKTQP